MSWYLKNCKKCGGDMFDNDDDGRECMSCGFIEYAQKPLDVVHEKKITPKGIGCEIFPDCDICPAKKCVEDMTPRQRVEFEEALKKYFSWPRYYNDVKRLFYKVEMLQEAMSRYQIELRQLKGR